MMGNSNNGGQGLQGSNSSKRKDNFKAINSASPSLHKLSQNQKKLSSNIGIMANQNQQSCHGSSQIHMMPCTPEVFKRTKRILFARRMNLMDRPLLIVEF
jgi:hypothetical protein